VSELLRRSAEEVLTDMVALLFRRLSTFKNSNAIVDDLAHLSRESIDEPHLLGGTFLFCCVVILRSLKAISQTHPPRSTQSTAKTRVQLCM
jgi:hypothetical protein